MWMSVAVILHSALMKSIVPIQWALFTVEVSTNIYFTCQLSLILYYKRTCLNAMYEHLLQDLSNYIKYYSKTIFFNNLLVNGVNYE